ncbi:hypothetical protein T484DRAFT_1870361 [Baffinella frigidus]|nr:hypothetical protein T484DRAFT_1870361 [Cryptophyta sp. CCMP2293]
MPCSAISWHHVPSSLPGVMEGGHPSETGEYGGDVGEYGGDMGGYPGVMEGGHPSGTCQYGGDVGGSMGGGLLSEEVAALVTFKAEKAERRLRMKQLDTVTDNHAHKVMAKLLDTVVKVLMVSERFTQPLKLTKLVEDVMDFTERWRTFPYSEAGDVLVAFVGEVCAYSIDQEEFNKIAAISAHIVEEEAITEMFMRTVVLPLARITPIEKMEQFQEMVRGFLMHDQRRSSFPYSDPGCDLVDLVVRLCAENRYYGLTAATETVIREAAVGWLYLELGVC